jgi:photosystem II stability/assembly factor-like uncharacterized protein
MKKLFTVLFIFSAFVRADSQWILQPSPSIFDILSGSFLDANTGYISGYGNSIFKTTNGGQNWIDLSFPGTANNINVIYFFNANTGFVGSTNDTVYRTTNGGMNWSTGSYIGFQPQSVSFPDANTGYIGGFNSLGKTTNAGLNWTTSFIPTWGAICFVNPSSGWTSDINSGYSNIYKTTNGGNNWQLQATYADFHYFYTFFFLNENIGWAGGYREFILKTTNGGINWVTQNENVGNPGIYSIYFTDENTGWAAADFSFSGGSKVFYTTNSGDTWSSFFLSTNAGKLSSVQFVNQNTGFLTGQYGKVFKTSNRGGLTSVGINNNEIPHEFNLYQNYPNPFNPTTKIRFEIPSDVKRKTSNVKLIIYDITGKEVAVLVNEALQPGSYEVVFDAGKLSSGIYFYKLNADIYTSTKRMVLIK